ncbi:MAG: ChaN family lipoprotein [Thermodesulfovibrionales bacterium]|nr:ChaN family lipoprotein [Thermodesulfovibrionales bacterium]
MYTFLKNKFLLLLLLLGIVLATFSFLIISFSYSGKYIFKVEKGRYSFQNMVDDLTKADVVFIGESHGFEKHHETQLEIIKALHEKGIAIAIGLEMFTAQDQKILDRWVSGEIGEREFIEAFYRNWGIGWKYYKDIFLYARDNKIPMVGLNVPREITRKIAEKGFLSLTEKELSKLPPGISCEVDEKYMDLLIKIFQVKAHDRRSFQFFCEAQIAWDQSMAWYINEYMKRNPQRKVVVLTGSIHAWKYGIPRQLKRLADLKYRVILPDLPSGSEKVTVDDADYIIFHR